MIPYQWLEDDPASALRKDGRFPQPVQSSFEQSLALVQQGENVDKVNQSKRRHALQEGQLRSILQLEAMRSNPNAAPIALYQARMQAYAAGAQQLRPR